MSAFLLRDLSYTVRGGTTCAVEKGFKASGKLVATRTLKNLCPCRIGYKDCIPVLPAEFVEGAGKLSSHQRLGALRLENAQSRLFCSGFSLIQINKELQKIIIAVGALAY